MSEIASRIEADGATNPGRRSVGPLALVAALLGLACIAWPHVMGDPPKLFGDDPTVRASRGTNIDVKLDVELTDKTKESLEKMADAGARAVESVDAAKEKAGGMVASAKEKWSAWRQKDAPEEQAPGDEAPVAEAPDTASESAASETPDADVAPPEAPAAVAPAATAGVRAGPVAPPPDTERPPERTLQLISLWVGYVLALVGLGLGAVAWSGDAHPGLGRAAVIIAVAAVAWQYVLVGIGLAVLVIIVHTWLRHAG